MSLKNHFLKSLAAIGVFVTSVQTIRAQEEPESARITTKDGVTLSGLFYPATKSKQPVVMLLHQVGDHKTAGGKSRTKAWVQLARDLQKAGFAVFAFDFRGHGQSTLVEPKTFWNRTHFRYNATYVKGFGKDNIEYKNFQKAYLPVLANDITAAKAYLDRKNDEGKCNSANLILIGAETGAAIGSLWLKSEYYRYKYTPRNIIQMTPARIDPQPQGRDVIGAIWMSIAPKIGTYSTHVRNLLYLPGNQRAVPMAFMYGADDKKSQYVARVLEKTIVTDKKKFEFTAAVPVPNTNLKGADLLQVPGVTKIIGKYVQTVVQHKGSEWLEREFTKSQFIWNFGTAGTMILNVPNDLTLIYDPFVRFLR